MHVVAHRERGMTLLEMMVAVLVFTIVVGAILSVIVIGARFGRDSMDQSDVQRSARMALTTIGAELELAGLGLPARLAIKEYIESASSVAGSCDGTPVLEVAALDYLREWVVSTTSGSTAGGTITLADPTPTGAPDAAIRAGEWLFFYQSTNVDAGDNGDHGHGFVRVGADRAAGETDITIDSTNFSSKQTVFNLGQSFSSTSGGHVPVVLRARTSRFGINCDDPNKRYLFLSRNGQPAVPMVSNVETLRFRFLVDAEAQPNGQPDDQDGDGDIDAADLVSNPDIATVHAVEVYLKVRADKPDPQTGQYRSLEISQLVPTLNINTAATQYIFVDNTGL